MPQAGVVDHLCTVQFAQALGCFDAVQSDSEDLVALLPDKCTIVQKELMACTQKLLW